MIATSVAATVTEQVDQTLSLTPDSTAIAVNFTDVDLTNTNFGATVTGVSASGLQGPRRAVARQTMTWRPSHARVDNARGVK